MDFGKIISRIQTSIEFLLHENKSYQKMLSHSKRPIFAICNHSKCQLWQHASKLHNDTFDEKRWHRFPNFRSPLLLRKKSLCDLWYFALIRYYSMGIYCSKRSYLWKMPKIERKSLMEYFFLMTFFKGDLVPNRELWLPLKSLLRLEPFHIQW